MVREMARYGADINGLVPDELIDFIKEKAEQWRK
jgi:phosphopantetheine adenylyltransferase